jgi:hypothetical protein
VPRTFFDRLITLKTLKLMDVNGGFLDLIADDQLVHNVPLKNVCAKVTPALADEIDRMAVLLGISKRRFLEAAFIEALRQAEEIMEREGWEDYLEERAKGSPASEGADK